jgi:toxin ParE1/3/4
VIYKLELQSEAIIDMRESFAWYEQRKPGLGFTFLEEIDLCLSKIVSHPLHYSFVSPTFRKIKVDRFPFVVVYEIEQDTIYVTGVRHTGRAPKE